VLIIGGVSQPLSLPSFAQMLWYGCIFHIRRQEMRNRRYTIFDSTTQTQPQRVKTDSKHTLPLHTLSLYFTYIPVIVAGLNTLTQLVNQFKQNFSSFVGILEYAGLFPTQLLEVPASSSWNMACSTAYFQVLGANCMLRKVLKWNVCWSKGRCGGCTRDELC